MSFFQGSSTPNVRKETQNTLSIYRGALRIIRPTLELLRIIIYPLQDCHGTEAFHEITKYTGEEVKRGSLRNVGEVEVSLVLNGKVSSTGTLSRNLVHH